MNLTKVNHAIDDVMNKAHEAEQKSELKETKADGPLALTTATGRPVDDNRNSMTAGERGPLLMQDFHLLEKIAHFDRERIPERVVHAKGAGAHGYFEVTHDVTPYCKAKFLNKIGKRTPVFGRLSTVIGEKGTPDSARDPRGFAFKHYTEEGIYDMVGNNTPIFFARDPSQFVDFIHSQKRNPQTGLWDPNSFWDWASLVPESVHQFTFLFSDRGIPASFRHINGYSSHTFKWVNAKNEGFWIKLHYKPEAGIKNLTPEEAQAVGAEDPDHARRDLFDTIASGQEVAWTAFYQIMTIEEGLKYKWDIFDITKVWPHGDHPLHPFGRLVLNRNPQNFFAETEQVAFSPGNLVPGIEPSMDKFLQARLFSYGDTQRHRIGGNFMQLPINCPYATRVHNQQRDGPMCIISQGAQPTYYPNSVDKIEVVPETKMQPSVVSGTIDRHPYNNDDFAQPREFYNKVLKEDQRQRLINNIVNGLSAARKDIQDRMVAIFRKVDQDYGDRVEKGLAAKQPKHVMQKIPASV